MYSIFIRKNQTWKYEASLSRKNFWTSLDRALELPWTEHFQQNFYAFIFLYFYSHLKCIRCSTWTSRWFHYELLSHFCVYVELQTIEGRTLFFVISIFEPLCVLLENAKIGVFLVNVELLHYFELNFLVYSLVMEKKSSFCNKYRTAPFFEIELLGLFFSNKENLTFSYTLNYSIF